MTELEAVSEFVNRTCWVARTAIPDLGSQPLYIVWPHDDGMVTPRLLGNRDGLYFRHLDGALRPELERQGQWRGPGVCVVINALDIYRQAAWKPDAERAIVGLTLHELAHWLNVPEPKPIAPEDCSARYEDFVRECERPEEAHPIPAGFWAHHREFTRLAVHVWWRAKNSAGCYLRPELLRFGSSVPGLEKLSEPGEYINALLPELEGSHSVPLRTAVATTAPLEFVELWAAGERRIMSAALQHTIAAARNAGEHG